MSQANAQTITLLPVLTTAAAGGLGNVFATAVGGTDFAKLFSGPTV